MVLRSLLSCSWVHISTCTWSFFYFVSALQLSENTSGLTHFLNRVCHLKIFETREANYMVQQRFI